MNCENLSTTRMLKGQSLWTDHSLTTVLRCWPHGPPYNSERGSRTTSIESIPCWTTKVIVTRGRILCSWKQETGRRVLPCYLSLLGEHFLAAVVWRRISIMMAIELPFALPTFPQGVLIWSSSHFSSLLFLRHI